MHSGGHILADRFVHVHCSEEVGHDFHGNYAIIINTHHRSSTVFLLNVYNFY